MRLKISHPELLKLINARLKELFIDAVDMDIFTYARISPVNKNKEIGLYIHMNLGEGKIPEEFTSRLIETKFNSINKGISELVFQKAGYVITHKHYITLNNGILVTYTNTIYD